jgi:peptide-methionine (R)-S-oxide reductase
MSELALALGSSVRDIVTEMDSGSPVRDRVNTKLDSGSVELDYSSSRDEHAKDEKVSDGGSMKLHDESLTLTPRRELRRKVITGALMKKWEDEMPNKQIEDDQQKKKSGMIEDRQKVDSQPERAGGFMGIHDTIELTPRKIVKCTLASGALPQYLKKGPPLNEEEDESKCELATVSTQVFVSACGHKIDGGPLPHWDKSNFELKRDASARIICEPKQGSSFYEEQLNEHDLEILRQSGIEQPYFSKYNRFFPDCGHFCCKACGNPLYCRTAKFDADNGWPAFGACVDGAVEIGQVPEWGPDIIEIHCHRCKSHLGNIVEEENKLNGTVFVERHRVNGRALQFIQTDLPKRTMADTSVLFSIGSRV